MPVMRYREALNQALREEMEADERVFIMGEDIGVFQGAFKVTQGLLEEFGDKRGPTHSHCLEAMFLHVPGLLVAAPSTAADAKGLLKAAIQDDNPVIFIEHETLYGQKGEVPENGGPARFGEAAVRREGDDVTIVGISRMAVTAAKAAETLSDEHEIEADVIDPRTLRPLDLDTILESVKKTNRAVIVEEGWPHGGVGANLAALIPGQGL